jgi:hypothetical protein
MNATDGVKIQKGDGSGNVWTDAIYLDTSGNGTFTGFVLASQFIGGSLLIGGTAFSTAPFSVTTSGAATAANLLLTGAVITIGTSSNTMRFNATDGLWLGATAAATAPFTVAMSGSVTVRGGTITGGTIQSAETGARTVIHDNQIDFYDSNSNLSMVFPKMTGNLTKKIIFYNGGNEWGHIETTLGNDIAFFGPPVTSGNQTAIFMNDVGTMTLQGNQLDGLDTNSAISHDHTVTIGTANYTTSSAGLHAHNVKFA